MGRLLEGEWIANDLGSDAQGRYVRRATQFRSQIPSPEFPVEGNGRYILVLSHACGWSHRVLLVRAIKGLEDAIPVVFCDPFMGQEKGWTLGEKGIVADVLFAKGQKLDAPLKCLYELYLLAKTDYTGRASVPVLWDTHTGTIVSNESSDIIQFLCKEFEDFANNKGVDLLPESIGKDAIDEMTKTNYGPVNNGVYKCGFASSQEAYTEAATALFDRLDELEELLSKQRYLMGSQITLADLCLFPTIYRFDHVYYTHFKCSKQHIYEYPNLWGWCKEIFQMPGVADTCDMDKIREHYFTSHESIHPRRYIPLAPKINFSEVHGRDEKTYNI